MDAEGGRRTSRSSRGSRRGVEIDDLLVEPPLESLRHCYLNVEGILGMVGVAPVISPADIVGLMEQSLRGGGAVRAADQPVTQYFVFEELQRLNRFVNQAVEREWSRLVHASGELWGAVEESAGLDAGSAGGSVRHDVARIRSILDCSRGVLQDLDVFVRHNVVLGAYVANCLAGGASAGQRQADVVGEQSQSQSQASHDLYVVGIERLLMRGVMMSSVLVALSDLYEGVRVLAVHGRVAKQVLEGVVKAEWKAPSKFSRVVKKFWILPKDVMRFKLFVMQHLPILVYGEREKLLDAACRGRTVLRPGEFACADSGEIASVYLDSMPSLQHYHDRLHRRDKAMATRIRWYGARDPADGDKSIFVERKTHRNAYTGLTSTKERGCIKQRDVNAFLRGEYAIDGGHKDAELLAGVMEEIRDEQQEILMRTTYSRTAFQNATENTVRISLDTNLCMTKEYGYQTAESWCRDLGSFPLCEDDVAQFPYGVVEIKLQASPPQWVRDLVNSGMLLVVPKFSKFLHGTAALYQQTTENVPYWFLPDPRDKELLTPATWDEMADKECIYAKDAADWLFPQGFELAANQERHLTLPFFRPKAARAATAATGAAEGLTATMATMATMATAATSTDRMRDASAREAMRELEDESGNRTWCDVETETEEVIESPGGQHACDRDRDSSDLATQPRSTPRKPSWTVYQSAGDPADDDGHRDDDGQRHSEVSGSECDTSHYNCEYGTSHCGTATPTTGSERSGVTPLTVLPLGVGREGQKPQRESSLQPIQPSPYSMSGSFGVMQYSMSMNKSNKSNDGEDKDSNGDKRVSRKRSASIVRTRVEPKTFFANERTFLQWINVSVLVMFLALSLLSGSAIPGLGSGMSSTCDTDDGKCLAGKMSGAIIATVALSFMGYALYMYKKRTLQILRRETVRYDDQRGPVVLVVILLLAMTISYILTMIFVF